MIININWFRCQFCHMSSNRHNCCCLRCWSLWILALVTIFAVCLLSWALWITVLVAFFANAAFSTPHRKWFMVGIRSGKFFYWSSCALTVLVGGRLQGWFPLTRLPWNLPGVPGIFAGHPPTCQAHQSAMSLTSWKGSNFHCEVIPKPPSSLSNLLKQILSRTNKIVIQCP